MNVNTSLYLKKTFISIDKKHHINISIIDEISWFEIDNMDFEHLKTFMILLKDILIYCKNNNVKIIKHHATDEDMCFFKKSSKINLNKNIWLVSTNIEDFLEEIINVFNIKKI